MRNVKKTLALILSLAMILSAVVVPSAGAAFDTAADYRLTSSSNMRVFVAESAPEGALLWMTPSAFNTLKGTGAATLSDLPTASGLSYFEVASRLSKYNSTNKTVEVATADGITAGFTGGSAQNATVVIANLASGQQVEGLVRTVVRVNGSADTTNQSTASAVEVGKDTFGEYKQIPFHANIKGLVNGASYTWDLVLTDTSDSNKPYTLKSGSFTADTTNGNGAMHLANQFFTGENGPSTTSDGKNITYKLVVKPVTDYRVSDATIAHDYTVTNGKFINQAAAADVTFSSMSFPTTITPGTMATWSATATNFNSATDKNGPMFMVVRNAGGVVAIVPNSGTDANVSFNWDGKMINAVPSNFGGTSTTLGIPNENGRLVSAGTYTMFFVWDIGKTAADAPNRPNRMPATKYTKSDDRSFTVAKAPAMVEKLEITYTTGTAGTNASLIPSKNVAHIAGSASVAATKVYMEVLDAQGAVLTGFEATTDPNGAFSYDFLGTYGYPVVTLADGVYTVSAYCLENNVKTTAKTYTLVVGAKVNINTIAADPVNVGIGTTAEVPIKFTPANASVTKVSSVTQSSNAAFTVKAENGVLKVTGVTMTEAGKPATATVEVTFEDGTKKQLALTVNVTPLASSMELGTTILRKASGETDKILINFLPAGTTGVMPKFEVDNPLIATVDADGTVHFLAEGRAVVKVTSEQYSFEGEVILCTTTPYIDELKLYPLVDTTIPRAVEKKVSAYARPVHVADGGITYTSSNPMTVFLPRADQGTIIGLAAGDSTITATSVAKNRDGQQLSASVVITVR